MSLRLRVVLLIGLVLLASMALGALVAGYQVRQALDAELAAGLGGARQTVASAFEDLPQSDHPDRDLRQLVETFDGNRHVRASVHWLDGRRGWSSRTDPAPPPPKWFLDLVEVTPAPVTMLVPRLYHGTAIIVLSATPDLDAQVAWNEFLALMGVLAGTTSVGLLLVYLVIGAAFRPLTTLALRFRQIGAGDYSGRVTEAGPPDLLQLQRGYNHMAEQLAVTTERNRLLTDQLSRLQDEERAEIARDLHDEIGPHLFAVNLDAEMISRFAESGGHFTVVERVRDIQSAVRYMQKEVRELLGRLRPTQLTEFGLNPAIRDLVRSWSARQADIAFDLVLSEEEVPDATAEVAYRIVQEGVNNAVRHSKPAIIRIAIKNADGRLGISVQDDGPHAAAFGFQPATSSGLGLIGMRERVEAGGGVLIYGPNSLGSGWTIAAELPVVASRKPPVPGELARCSQ